MAQMNHRTSRVSLGKAKSSGVYLPSSVTLYEASDRQTATRTKRQQSYLSFFLEEKDGRRKPRFFFFFSGVASVVVGDAADTYTTAATASPRL